MKKDNLKDKIKKNAYLIVGVLILLVLWLYSFFAMGRRIPHKSKDKIIDNAINVIDVCIDSFGTFNADHLPIFEVLQSLTKEQIEILHVEFGMRFYNPLFRTYKIVDNFGFRGYSQPFNLKALFLAEFDSVQIERLELIYRSKGLQFLTS
ncbi:hypothetical protein [Tenacibaculum finnmarkense]|uniref:hypothetical protein n=1 Tax=Tenacibaculum finnmarkense TaxID=2781243 RepID=UPI001EFC2373|nr:hypothetical protein [Tenacibaculum finnmarkense]MCG8249224.1 hypothetical protein [Tenacibaculum finnmarkense genomovar finnmarkense]MCG8729523.1 hypothetical protein [Tenacibaculum finnmarkense]MCG8734174.1 hypothetical protein [Tenacibaculum finnmarkense]MCG8759526.1 hypothetical protein [Tenacibaculum finnmarkense]MCG8866580.1 hypothetical protein [Tenacibaculum finnmarkense]